MAERDILIIEEDSSYCSYDNISDLPSVDEIVLPDISEDSETTTSKNHNDLKNIQGGKNGERYHLTKREYDAIREADNPSETNPFITKNELEIIQSESQTDLRKIDGGDAFGSNFHPSER